MYSDNPRGLTGSELVGWYVAMDWGMCRIMLRWSGGIQKLSWVLSLCSHTHNSLLSVSFYIVSFRDCRKEVSEFSSCLTPLGGMNDPDRSAIQIMRKCACADHENTLCCHTHLMRPIVQIHLTVWAGKAHDLRPKCLVYEAGDYTPPVHKDDHARSYM